MAGARWVQQEILAKHPTAKLKVYTVWLTVMAGDRRTSWDAGLMPDPRVENLWDANRGMPVWFAKNVDGGTDFVWDAYFLYGPDAKWDSAPAPLLSSGGTIISQQDELSKNVLPLIK